MFGPPSKTFVLVFYQTVKTFRRSYCEMEMKQNTVWKKKGFGVCMLMCFYNHVAKCDQFEVKLVDVWELALKCSVCVYFHHVSWHMFPLLLAANGEFPPRSLSTHRPCTRRPRQSKSTLKSQEEALFFSFLFFCGALGVCARVAKWSAKCCLTVWNLNGL